MFDFQKEVIINSAEVDGLARVALAKYTGTGANRTIVRENVAVADATHLSVLRCADYELDKITAATKTVGQVGTPEVITLAVPDGIAKGKIVHAEITIGLEGKYMADYANVWSKFGKDIVVEYEANTGDIAELAAHIKDALPLDNEFVKVSNSAITMINSNQVVKKAVVCLIEDDEETAHKDLTHSGRAREFATGEWLKENLRFPTHLNLRYDNVAGDDAPIDGAVYTQYTFQYESERKGLHGQGTVGQKLVSVTTHVFYVNNTCATVIAEFDKLIDETGNNDILENADQEIETVK